MCADAPRQRGLYRGIIGLVLRNGARDFRPNQPISRSFCRPRREVERTKAEQQGLGAGNFNNAYRLTSLLLSLTLERIGGAATRYP